ncbi:MAG: hypothetical protein V1754_15810, partial [Pseudomonadota bacterium]
MKMCKFLCIEIIVLVLGFAAPSAASVDISATTACLNRQSIAERVEKVMKDMSSNRTVDLLVLVQDEQPEKDQPVIVHLRAITGDGQVVLKRKYELGPKDCKSADELLATVLERFLTRLPLEQWTLPPTRPAKSRPLEQTKPVEKPVNIETTAQVVINSAWVPFGGDTELAIGMRVGQRHGLEGCLLGRMSLPQKLGQGRVIAGMPLGCLGWSYNAAKWRWKTDVRAGAVAFAGVEYAVNHTTWLPWIEFTGSVWRKIGPVFVGLQIAVAPLRHQVMTKDKLQTTDFS